jgi:Ribonuclease G/E
VTGKWFKTPGGRTVRSVMPLSESTVPPVFITERCPRCGGRGRVRRVNPAALRSDRERRGLSVREIARRCGVSAAFVSDVERGHRAWSPRLAKGYSIKVSNV